jgi:DNA-binding helix-hairpin-helix protein with protein kinase domain
MSPLGNAVEIFDKLGVAQRVGCEIARGGEGTVFELESRPQVVVKLYHPEILSRRGTALEAKVERMIALRPSFRSLRLAWPALSICDASGAWRGYAMRRADGIPLTKLAHPMLCERYFGGLQRPELVGMLHELVGTVAQLHENGVRLGDINLNNFLYDRARSAVTLIDCDSYQVEAGGSLFRCPVGAPDMIPPEHHDRNLADVTRTVESDLFSIAILLFKCLMTGRHPYDFIGGNTVVQNLRAGHFPYGTGGAAPGREGAIPNGPWYVIWSHLTYELKNLFIRTLREGAGDPSMRAGAREWMDALARYRYGLDKGHHDAAIRPAAHKQSGLRGRGAQNSDSASVAMKRADPHTEMST